MGAPAPSSDGTTIVRTRGNCVVGFLAAALLCLISVVFSTVAIALPDWYICSFNRFVLDNVNCLQLVEFRVWLCCASLSVCWSLLLVDFQMLLLFLSLIFQMTCSYGYASFTVNSGLFGI